MSAIARLETAQRFTRNLLKIRIKLHELEEAAAQLQQLLSVEIDLARREICEEQATHVDPHPGVRA